MHPSPLVPLSLSRRPTSQIPAERLLTTTHRSPNQPPGFIGNYAGPSGMGAAVAIGFFPYLSAHAVNPYSVWDAVPGDLVASAILATAAAVARGLQREIAAATGSGAWVSELARPTAATVPSTLRVSTNASPLKGAHHARKLSMNSLSDDAASLIGAGSAHGGSGSGASGSGSPTPLSGVSEEEESSEESSPCATPAKAAVAAGPRRTDQPLLIVHATTSTTYPAIVYEAYNTAVDFLRVHGCKTSILVGGARGLPNMPPTWRPSPELVKFWKFYNGVKVAIVCFLLK
jgi:hypothetical protein